MEWEVQKYYWNLYNGEEERIDVGEVLENIVEVKKVCSKDKIKLDKKISEEEVCRTLKEIKIMLFLVQVGSVVNSIKSSGGF